MRWWPRTIRWKMLFGLVLLEALSIVLFALLLVRLQGRDVRVTPRNDWPARPIRSHRKPKKPFSSTEPTGWRSRSG